MIKLVSFLFIIFIFNTAQSKEERVVKFMIQATEKGSNLNKASFHITEVNSLEIKKKSSELKKILCEGIAGDEVKVWFTSTVEGSLVVASGAATAGIEMSFKCK